MLNYYSYFYINKSKKAISKIRHRWLFKNLQIKYEKKNFAMRRSHGYSILYQVLIKLTGMDS